MDLRHYAKHGSLNGVKQLIELGRSVNTVHRNGQTALFVACEKGHYDVAEFLLRNGADANYKAKPLIAAARNGHADCVELLLKHGADFRCTNGKGESAISVAKKKMNLAVILLLTDHEANIDPYVSLDNRVSDTFGKVADAVLQNSLPLKSDGLLFAAFRCAFIFGSLELAVHLLSMPTQWNIQQFYPLALYHSAKHGWCDILTRLLKEGVDANIVTGLCTPLYAACKRGSVEAVRTLVQFGANPNLSSLEQQPICKSGREPLVSESDSPYTSRVIVNTTPLLWACRKGLLPIVTSLLSCGADPNLAILEDYPLSTACKYTHHEIVKLLLEHGANVQASDKDNKSALHHALESVSTDDSNPDLSTVNLLLDCGADTDTTASSGESLLYIACSRGLASTVQRMLQSGAKVNVSKNQKSPLNVACKNKRTAVVELLLNTGADPNIPEETVDTSSFPLHVAAAGHSSELVNMLLNYGARVNVSDHCGNTALHHAVSGGDSVKHSSAHSHFASTSDSCMNSQNVIDPLLSAGADVNMCNSKGQSSLYSTVENGLPNFVDAMLSHGGDPNVSTTGKFYVLSMATWMQNMRLVELLLKAGADPNLMGDIESERDLSCELPLCIAVKLDNCDLATMLLNCGAKVNMLNSTKESALHFAVKNLCRPFSNITSAMTKLLLEHGADVNQLMSDDLSPLRFIVNMYTFTLFDDVDALIQMFVSNGASLQDSLSPGDDRLLTARVNENEILCQFSVWHPRNRIAVELLKAGAGFKLIALSCEPSMFPRLRTVKHIQLCQAVVMAGYVASTNEVEELDPERPCEKVTQEHVKLVRWLTDDGQQAPSLMRQCRVTIRRQLTVASCHCTILPTINQLPLPRCLQQYLKFEGGLTEVDFDVESDNSDDDDDSFFLYSESVTSLDSSQESVTM